MDQFEQLMQVIENNTKALNALQGGMAVKTPASQTTATPIHGIGSIFGLGVDRDVTTAHIRPRGILSVLPRRPTLSEDPRFASITGFTDVTGTELTSATVCDDAPAGYMKSCKLTARFGLVRRDTQTIDALEVIRRIRRGDFTDLVMHGQVLGLQEFNPSGLSEDQILNIFTMSEMVNTAVQAERLMNTAAWQGTLAAAPYFPGLDSQIATGQVDADQNQACPALDSDVKDFTYNDVCGTGKDIVEYVSMLAKYLEWNANSSGLDPVEWVVVMRPELWFELSACWPCKYLTHRCLSANVGEEVAVINDSTNADMTRAMREGSFIWINGKQYPVIEDTGIYEANNINNGNLNAGEYASSIYFVPLRVNANMPGRGLEVTTLQYLDYRAATAEIRFVQDRFEAWWTDSGLFSWAYDGAKWCYKLALRCEPRVVLRTPQLAGKIDNVMYTPLQHLRSPDPDSPYHYDGGVSVAPAGTAYAVWM